MTWFCRFPKNRPLVVLGRFRASSFSLDGRSIRPTALMILATKTLAAINAALEKDQGALYRKNLGEALALCHDAFDPEEDYMPRSHLGSSLIGEPCPRKLWYSFHWAKYIRHEGRMVRLFNRGHLEEARFIALLRTGGLTTWHDTGEEGEKHQFRISGYNGHYGGSLDGIGANCPDLPQIPYFLLEFKTHSKASFEKLVKEGVDKAKPMHVIQCNQYMGEWGLPFALYCAVCKNNDELHLEILPYDSYLHHSYFDRAGKIIGQTTPPPRLHDSASWYDCKYCDFKGLCFGEEQCAHNCRTCRKSCEGMAASWLCVTRNVTLSKEAQYQGCDSWDRREGL